MDTLRKLIGSEHNLDDVCRALRKGVRELDASVVGAVHVTCSDESERECVDTFQREFVDPMLPRLKPATKSPFRTASLGGRYEWGAVTIAELRYAAYQGETGFKCVVIKINAHVAVTETPTGPRYGRVDRFRCESYACGALHATLDGSPQPFATSLRQALTSEHKDRVAMLCDPARVDPEVRSLFAAVASARLQARVALLEIQDHRPTTPTVFIVLPCVTLNRPTRDTEFVCGYYDADTRTGQTVAQYYGLGDDPSRYEYGHSHKRACIADDQIHIPRPVRDHRALVYEAWQQLDPPAVPADPRIDEVARAFAAGQHHDHPYAKAMAGILLATLTEIAPVPTVMVLFAEGAIGLHHAHHMHKLAKDGGDEHEARRILRDAPAATADLHPDHTRRIVEKLLAIRRR